MTVCTNKGFTRRRYLLDLVKTTWDTIAVVISWKSENKSKMLPQLNQVGELFADWKEFWSRPEPSKVYQVSGPTDSGQTYLLSCSFIIQPKIASGDVKVVQTLMKWFYWSGWGGWRDIWPEFTIVPVWWPKTHSFTQGSRNANRRG